MRSTAMLLAIVCLSCARVPEGRDDAALPPEGRDDAALPPGHVPIEPAARAPGLGAPAQVLLDSGNVLFRRKAYAPALDAYRAATRAEPAHAAPWFGVYMVAKATGDRVLADSALAMMRARAPEAPSMPGGAAAGAPHGAAPHTLPPGSPHQAPRSPGRAS